MPSPRSWRASPSTYDSALAILSEPGADDDLGGEGEIGGAARDRVELRTEARVEPDREVLVHQVIDAESEHRPDLQERRVRDLERQVQVDADRDAHFRSGLDADGAAHGKAQEEIRAGAVGVDARA